MATDVDDCIVINCKYTWIDVWLNTVDLSK